MVNALNLMSEAIGPRDDILTQLLRLLQIEGTLTSCMRLESPWGIRSDFASERFSFHLIGRGECHLIIGNDPPVKLQQGDLVFFPTGSAHSLLDHPTTKALSIEEVLSDQQWLGNSSSGESTTSERSILICGAYSYRSDVSLPLIEALPQALILRSDSEDKAIRDLIELVIQEAVAPLLGSALATNRLLDALLVYSLRQWIRKKTDIDQTWLSAFYDRQLGPVIQAIHQTPSRLWTVDDMARLAGSSPSSLTRRFKAVVGEAPLAFVTRWRMALASELLRGGHSINTVAERVGYEDRFAFAKAFKRVRGVTPGRMISSEQV